MTTYLTTRVTHTTRRPKAAKPQSGKLLGCIDILGKHDGNPNECVQVDACMPRWLAHQLASILQPAD